MRVSTRLREAASPRGDCKAAVSGPERRAGLWGALGAHRHQEQLPPRRGGSHHGSLSPVPLRLACLHRLLQQLGPPPASGTHELFRPQDEGESRGWLLGSEPRLDQWIWMGKERGEV